MGDDYNIFADEIHFWRTAIRENGFLLDPECKKRYITLSGDLLDYKLLEFSSLVKMKRKAFFDKVVVNELFSVGNKLEPVYITPSERENAESLSNQTREKCAVK